MCVNDEHGAPICDDNGVPFGGFAPSTKLLELQALGPLYIPLRPLQSPYTHLHPLYPLTACYAEACRRRAQGRQARQQVTVAFKRP